MRGQVHSRGIMRINSVMEKKLSFSFYFNIYYFSKYLPEKKIIINVWKNINKQLKKLKLPEKKDNNTNETKF